MSATYKIVNFADIMRVPAERRDECLRELQYSLLLLELAFEPEDAHMHGSQGFTWVDDGVRSVTLNQADDSVFLKLDISAAPTVQEGAKE